MHSTHDHSRLGAASGAAFVLGAIALNSAGSSSDPVIALEALALTLFVPFAAYLHGLLRQAGWVATAALGAGLVAVAVKLAGVLPDALVQRGELGGELGAAFTRLGEVSFVLSMVPFGVFLGLVAAAALRTGALPAPLAWGAAAVAPLLLLNGLDLGAEFGPAFIAFLAWTLAASVVLLRRAVRAAPAATPAAASAA